MISSRSSRGERSRALARLGVEPPYAVRLHEILSRLVAEASDRAPRSLAVLDAGCGHKSPLAPFRTQIARFVGTDIHAPPTTPTYLDEFEAVDLCRPSEAFPDETFDLILSNFTLEHFDDPPTALANMYRWLRPGGRLVLSTVNRRHPFVAAYLAVPERPRRRLQALVKASPADAHRLVGRCNDPAAIRDALGEAGFAEIRIETLGHLGRAWSRRLPTFVLGAIGDVMAQSLPSRRSTIIAVASKVGETGHAPRTSP